MEGVVESEVQILHMSDLHIGATGLDTVWKSLATFVNNTLKPDLILVTGDIADTPEETLFREARHRLEGLHTNHGFRVCAGNHDRHPKGNAPGPKKSWGRRIIEYVRGPMGVSAWFNEVFQKDILTIKPEEFQLGAWRVAVVGVDSSSEAQYSAQGYVPPNTLQDMQDLSGHTASAELVIVLVHHHLLPIAALEPSTQKLRDIFVKGGTIMLNAGSILERFSEQHINLVLHGHEHCRALARYVSPKTDGEITVVGAGSSTGMETNTGCDTIRATMNLIVLKPDRTVWVEEVKCKNQVWERLPETQQQLFDSRSIRRAKLMRRHKVLSPPTSRIVKNVEFTDVRDILLRETRTDWFLDTPAWKLRTQNSSGQPSSPVVSLQQKGQGTEEYADSAPVFAFSDKENAHIFEARFQGTGPRVAHRLNAQWMWLAGAALTKKDLDLIPMKHRGPYRSNGREYVSIKPDEPIESFTLMVTVPPRFAPKEKADVSVFVKEPEKKGEEGEPNEEFTRNLDFWSQEKFSLTVPFPLVNHEYAIAWNVPDEPAVDIPQDGYAVLARPIGETLVNTFLKSIEREMLGSAFSVALYVVRDESRNGALRRFDNVGHFKEGNIPEPKQEWVLDYQIPNHAIPLRGESIAVVAEDNRLKDDEFRTGFLEGERTLTILPLLHKGCAPPSEPWGILRVATWSEAISAKIAAEIDAHRVQLGKSLIHIESELIQRGSGKCS